RTVRMERGNREHVGWIAVAPSRRRAALRLTVSASLAAVLPAILGRVKHLFDLGCHPDEIATALGALARAHPGLRLPGAMDGFELAVRAILGQQITVAAASTLARRFVDAFGDALADAPASLHRLFPRPSAVATLEPAAIARCG